MAKLDFSNMNLELDAIELAKQSIAEGNFDIDCPHCQKSITAPAGESICPLCHNKISLDLEFNF